jgi:hypothetical protein
LAACVYLRLALSTFTTMAEPLFELLNPYFDTTIQTSPSIKDPSTSKYLNRLTTLQLSALTTTEPLSLSQSSHTTLLSIQALSTRSSKAIIQASDELKTLQTSLPALATGARELQDGISTLDKSAVRFSEKYSRSSENAVLDRRKRALLMSRNVDRMGDILDLPALLSSAISSSAAQGAGAGGGANYASALDLYAHIKRLHGLYPVSELVAGIHEQAEEAMREMTTGLIGSLRMQNIKLAAGMRTVGWLRRIAPKLDGGLGRGKAGSGEGSLGALFLVCRLANLLSMLEALDPLRELAEQESERIRSNVTPPGQGRAWSSGQQTERYLKRYVEIFREQSFAIISMFNSIFPADEGLGTNGLDIQFKSLGLKSTAPTHTVVDQDDPLLPLPSALSTFPLHLIELLTATLKKYLPNVKDKSSRESLLTQVLYCAGSLGRLGGDFGMILATLHDDEDEEDENTTPEWVAVMKKHKVLAGRLETLASGKGVRSPELDTAPKVLRT